VPLAVVFLAHEDGIAAKVSAVACELDLECHRKLFLEFTKGVELLPRVSGDDRPKVGRRRHVQNLQPKRGDEHVPLLLGNELAYDDSVYWVVVCWRTVHLVQVLTLHAFPYIVRRWELLDGEGSTRLEVLYAGFQSRHLDSVF
jgi:hypothetical protein